MSTYIDLLVGPAVHAQRLHLGHVGAQLAVDGGASHAQENAQLQTTMLALGQHSASSAGACKNTARGSRFETFGREGEEGRVLGGTGARGHGGRHTLHDAQPNDETMLVPMLFAKELSGSRCEVRGVRLRGLRRERAVD